MYKHKITNYLKLTFSFPSRILGPGLVLGSNPWKNIFSENQETEESEDDIIAIPNFIDVIFKKMV